MHTEVIREIAVKVEIGSQPTGVGEESALSSRPDGTDEFYSTLVSFGTSKTKFL